MSAYSEQVRAYVQRYQEEFDSDSSGLIDTHEIAAWALRLGLHKPNFRAMVDAVAADIAQVFREEYGTDKLGRRYRVMHAVKQNVKGKNLTLWANLDDRRAPRGHFVDSFAQRRRQIVGDCVQLKTDVDVYNDKNPQSQPIQIVLDFSEDVAELQLLRPAA